MPEHIRDHAILLRTHWDDGRMPSFVIISHDRNIMVQQQLASMIQDADNLQAMQSTQDAHELQLMQLKHQKHGKPSASVSEYKEK